MLIPKAGRMHIHRLSLRSFADGYYKMIEDPSQNPHSPLKKQHFKIGEAARILGVHRDTLRRWEKSGKIIPIRTPGKTRLYSLTHLRNLNPEVTENLPTALPQEVPLKSTPVEEKLPRSGMPEFLAVSAAMFLLLMTLGLGNIKLSEFKNLQPAPNSAVLGKTTEIPASTPEVTPVATSEAQPEITPEPTPTTTVMVKTDDETKSVNIRQKPTTDSKKIGEAKNGDAFEFVSLDSDWYEIKLADRSTGFISAEYIKTEETN